MLTWVRSRDGTTRAVVFTFFEHVSSKPSIVFDRPCELLGGSPVEIDSVLWRWVRRKRQYWFTGPSEDSNKCYQYFRQASRWAGNLCGGATGSVSIWHLLKRKSSNLFPPPMLFASVSPPSLTPDIARTERNLASMRWTKEAGAQRSVRGKHRQQQWIGSFKTIVGFWSLLLKKMFSCGSISSGDDWTHKNEQSHKACHQR